MKRFFLILIFLLPLISALEISEVELNPAGQDRGNEWIEFYSESEINLTNYKIQNNDGDEIILNGSVNGYYVLNLDSQWLDNSDEKVFLYFNEELIQETDLFEDSKNSNLTFSYCDIWKFQEQTKGNKNDCEEVKEEIEEEVQVIEEKEIEEEIEKEQEEKKDKTKLKRSEKNFTEKEVPILKTIYLNPKTFNSIKSEEKAGNKNYTKYPIIIFCILLLFLYVIKPRKRKNEWRGK